jgi:hypothetical protein
MFLRRRAILSLDRWRRKLIRETEAALALGLLHPERNPRIPTIMVGVGEFDSRWARRWWSSVLELDERPTSDETSANGNKGYSN